jgi:hypothetical protein
MDEPDEQIIEDSEIAPDEFDADNLDLTKLDDEETSGEIEHPPGKLPVFLARLQWWGFGILIAFIILVILRMIFGPPWMDRFRFPRPPVAIDQANCLAGVIVPLSNRKYSLFFVDSTGHIRTQKDLGVIQPGPLDLVMGDDVYYFIYGDASWVAVRPYVQMDEKENFDLDLSQFNVKLRDGIDAIHSQTGDEYLNVFTENGILTLNRGNSLWEKAHEYSTAGWGERNWRIVDLAENHAIVESKTAFLLVDFPDFIDGYRKHNETTFIQFIQQRPQYQLEYMYKPVSIAPAEDMDRNLEYFLLKNDRMFNLPYKYLDDQIYVKTIGEKDMAVFNHAFIHGKDIRGIAVFSNDSEASTDSSSKPADLAILYESARTFYLAGIAIDKETPVWNILLGKSYPPRG